jgi:hypothetical protein
MTTATKAGEKANRPAVERRRAVRYRCMSECLVRVEGAAEPLDWPGMVYNISATGIGLALPFPAMPGMILVIEPRRRRGGPGLCARARVVRAGLRQYVWFHGAEFLERLPDEEFALWLAELRGGRIAER